jgi:hypothetical protein
MTRPTFSRNAPASSTTVMNHLLSFGLQARTVLAE